MQIRKLLRPTLLLSLLPALLSATLFAQYDQSDPPASIARIGYLNGNVSLQAYGSDQWADAPQNYPMVGGDRLYTGPGSRAVVQLGGAEMRIWQATDVTLTNLSDNFEQIGLAQGALRLRVFQMEPGSQIEVDTPNGAALINSPGDYRIEAFAQGSDQGASSILTINSGNAQLTGPNINLPVSSGYSVGLFGQDPVQLQYLDVPDYDNLDYWSISLDQRLQNSVSARYVSRQMVGYGDLDANGTWSQDPEYGPVWYPKNVPYGWQPYSTGHWAYVQPWGYTWVDDAPWGFAPFHYGRWSQRGDRWGWFPGPPAVRPVYSPALVAFVGGAPDEGRRGGGGISIGISFGGSGGGISAWFPIGVGEPYVPWYRCSPRYAQRVNETNVNVNVIHNTTVVNNYNTYINKTVINNTTINNTTVNNTVVNNFNYSNRRAVTAVPINAVSSGASVGRQMVHLTPQQQQQVAQAPISVRPTAPQPVAAHPSLVPAVNVARPVMRPTLMTPTGQAARAVASPVIARPVAVNQLPPARIMPQTPPPPPAAPKPVQQNRVNAPVNASAPIRPVIQPAPVQRPVGQPVQQPVARPVAQPGQQPVQQPVTKPVIQPGPTTNPSPVTRPVPQQPEAQRPAPVAAPPVQRPTPPQQQQPQPQPRQFTPPEQRPITPTPPQVNRPAPTPTPAPTPAPVQRPAPEQQVRPVQPQQRPVPPAQQVKPQPEPVRPAPQVRPVTPPPQPQVQPRPIPPQQVRPQQKPDDRLAPKPKDEPKQDEKPN
ncbi:hypothetical protein HDF16_003279 [Granulicella aggregans]|uniref:FecR family protein n=1 Tax=Granulicella aggregans TaxID=474949 RepID=A0A7W8E5V0_9BACT|nr:DUF6600 domain-containing protein [Granulicella aggregans]MBB5058565.1 hypothetical protein [Granulicella aggregans]